MALTRWMIPFWRVIRPTKSTNGLSGSISYFFSTARLGVGLYWFRSIPLWITRIFS